MRKAIRLMIFLCLSVGGTGLILAQNTNSGDIRGTVTDQSGAVVPGVKVAVLNVDKNVTTTFTTDAAGLYDTGSIVPDHYILTFTMNGFATYQRGPITLEVGITTVNASLKVGQQTQKVVVTTDVPLLTTTTGAQSTTLQTQTLMGLPQVGADWENLVSLLPGASVTNYSSGEGSASAESINGNLPYDTTVADGAVTTVPMSMNSNVSILESVQEVQVNTSAFSAQYSAGGAVYNQISKGGTERFHGSAYEFNQNNAFNAAPYGFGQHATVPVLHYNNYGFNIGGPVLPRRMFFFFDYDNTIDNGSASYGFATVPTDAMKQGDFTGQPTIYDPTTQTVDANGVVHRQSFASEYGNGNKIPASMMDSVAKAIEAYYPEPNAAGTTVNGITSNNFFYSSPNKNPYIKYFGRLDYNVTGNNHMVLTETEQDNPAVFVNQNICPVNCQNGDGSSNAAQVSDVWTIRPDMINEARMGFSNLFAFYTPFSIGEGYPAKLGWKFAKADVFPDVVFYGSACCLELQPESNAVYKEFAFDPSDVLTMIRGKQVLHFGGEFLINRADSTAWGNINGGQMQFNGDYTAATQGATSTSGVPYADFLLGQVNEWNAGVTPEYGARLKFPQAFIQDDITVRPNFTLNAGLRWQGTTGWSEVKGNMASFDPTVINPANNTPGAMWYGFSHANGRTSLQAPVWDVFMPRFGFSYQPIPHTVVRGGVGLYAYTWSMDTEGAGMGGAFGSRGSLSDSTNGADDVVQLDSDGNSTEQPAGHSINSLYLSAPTTPQAFNGESVSYNEYHTPVPRVIDWTLSAERELGRNMVAELAYVASHGYGLNYLVDINQVPAGKLNINDAACTAGSTTCGRPYPLFQSISGSTNNANSNYNSLQASITRRFSNGLQFNANYTWAHMLDNMDSSGWGGNAGTQDFQSSYDPSANYGSSNFDIRNAFKGYAIYDLPFGKGQRFLNSNRVLNEVAGGWRLAPTLMWTSGSPFTPVMANDTSYAQAGALYPDLVGDPNSGGHSINQWFNNAAFGTPTPGTFGNVRRNSLYGPHYLLFNGALGKTFYLREGISLEIRGEADNVINHPSFGLPNSAIGPGQVSNITSVSVGGRTMQLYGRLSF